MPPVTRAQTRLLAKQQAAEKKKSTQPSQTRKQPPRKPRTKDRTSHKDISSQSLIHESHPQIASEIDHLSDSSSFITEYPWSCQHCSCQRGVFHGLTDECIHCSHSIMAHQLDSFDPWWPRIDLPYDRKELVTSVLQKVRTMGTVVIRATPQVGKTTLLKLLGKHILDNAKDLEPVYLSWDRKKKEDSWTKYLETKRQRYILSNAQERPTQKNARTIYLIDEAQSSYKEIEFWDGLVKNTPTRSTPLYVLVCVYGVQGVSRSGEPLVESQALRMHTLNRIELRPTEHCDLCMLFTVKDTRFVLKQWAIDGQIDIEDNVEEGIHTTSGGHPGMVGVLLRFLKDILKKDYPTQPLTRILWHSIILEHMEEITEHLVQHGRGVWTSFAENWVRQELEVDYLRDDSIYRHLSFPTIREAMKQAVQYPSGVTRKSATGLDALGFCHKMGYLHTEQRGDEITFTFASPLHRKVAYRRLFASPDPNELSKINLKELCMNAIARFSPSVLQHRRELIGSRSWGIPEAAFQDELYCCLDIERQHLPVLTEYSRNPKGRIDFFVPTKRWGIELLQSGTPSDIRNHVDRFETSTYRQWLVLEDFVIINFCARSALLSVEMPEQIQSHFVHVVIEPQEFVAEIYSHDLRLLKTWTLGEGRQRSGTVESIEVTPEYGKEEMDEKERAWRDELETERQEGKVAYQNAKKAILNAMELEKQVEQMNAEIEALKREVAQKQKRENDSEASEWLGREEGGGRRTTHDW